MAKSQEDFADKQWGNTDSDKQVENRKNLINNRITRTLEKTRSEDARSYILRLCRRNKKAEAENRLVGN